MRDVDDDHDELVSFSRLPYCCTVASRVLRGADGFVATAHEHCLTRRVNPFGFDVLDEPAIGYGHRLGDVLRAPEELLLLVAAPVPRVHTREGAADVAGCRYRVGISRRAAAGSVDAYGGRLRCGVAGSDVSVPEQNGLSRHVDPSGSHVDDEPVVRDGHGAVVVVRDPGVVPAFFLTPVPRLGVRECSENVALVGLGVQGRNVAGDVEGDVVRRGRRRRARSRVGRARGRGRSATRGCGRTRCRRRAAGGDGLLTCGDRDVYVVYQEISCDQKYSAENAEGAHNAKEHGSFPNYVIAYG